MRTYLYFNRYSSITRRMILFVVSNVLLLLNVMADDKQCPKCHGSGWQVTIPGVGHFGVEKKKQKCPVCGKMVFSGHKDKCTMCGGNGRIGTANRNSRNGVAEQRGAEGEQFFARYLTSSENSMRKALMQSLLATRYEVEKCSVCHGSKLCQHCGGIQNLSIDADITTLCRVCGGGGRCIACNGQGSKNGRTVSAHTPEEKEKIARNIKVFSELANLRFSQNITPGTPNGPSIGIDNNGNYYIKGRR